MRRCLLVFVLVSLILATPSSGSRSPRADGSFFPCQPSRPRVGWKPLTPSRLSDAVRALA
jgi:hypothetical protein